MIQFDEMYNLNYLQNARFNMSILHFDTRIHAHKNNQQYQKYQHCLLYSIKRHVSIIVNIL